MMKFYILKNKLHNETLDTESTGVKVYPDANGSKLINAEGYFWREEGAAKIDGFKFVKKAPVFDYFYLYNSTYEKEYDWVLLDAYGFSGQNIPSIRGFLISHRLKELLLEFKIAEPFCFYDSKLMFQGDKLDYYILQLAQNEWDKVNINLSSFVLDTENVRVKNKRDFRKLLKRNKEGVLSIKIVLEKYADLFYFAHIGFIVSSELKDAIQSLGAKDFEFNLIEDIEFDFSY